MPAPSSAERIPGIARAPFSTRVRRWRPSSWRLRDVVERRARPPPGRRPSRATSSTITASPRSVALELFGRALDDDLAAADDREPVGELVRLLEVVRREQDRQRLALGERAELVPHRGSRLGVEAGGRLVQEEDLRRVDEPERDVEPSLHPARVAVHDPVRGLGRSRPARAARRRASAASSRPAPERAPGASGSRGRCRTCRRPTPAARSRSCGGRRPAAGGRRGPRPSRGRRRAGSACRGCARSSTSPRRSGRGGRTPRPRARRRTRRRAP